MPRLHRNPDQLPNVSLPQKFVLILFLLIFSPVPAFSASIIVSWDRNPEPDIAGYRIYWRLPGEDNFHSKEITDNLHEPIERSYTIDGLEAGQTYYIGVTAFDMAGQESEMSSLIARVAQVSDEDGGEGAGESESEQYRYSGTFTLLYTDTVNGLQKPAADIEAAAGDINGDGFDDLILFGTDGIYSALSDGQNLTSPVMWYSYNSHDGEAESIGSNAATNGWKVIGCTDMNSDGVDDLILSNSSENKLAICLCSPQGIDHEVIIPDLDISSNIIYTPVDFNGDGFKEFLCQNSETGDLSFWYFERDESLNIQYSSLSMGNTSGAIIGVGNFDISGKAELMISLNALFTPLATLHTDEGDFGPQTYLDNQEAATMLNSLILATSGDFDGDGRDDLITLDLPSLEYYIWLVKDDAIKGYTPTGLAYNQDTYFFSTADINNDGLADLLFRSGKAGSFFIIITEKQQ